MCQWAKADGGGHFCRVLLHEPTGGSGKEIRGPEQQGAAWSGGGGHSAGVATVGKGSEGAPGQGVGGVPGQRRQRRVPSGSRPKQGRAERETWNNVRSLAAGPSYQRVPGDGGAGKEDMGSEHRGSAVLAGWSDSHEGPTGQVEVDSGPVRAGVPQRQRRH